MNQRIPLMAVWMSLLLLTGTPLRAVDAGNPVFTWTGNSSSSNFYNAANWAEGIAPPEDGTANILFGDLFKTYLRYYEIDVNQLAFIGNTRPYFLQGDYDTTHIGAGGIIYSPAHPVQSTISDRIQLEASQAWNIASGALVINGSISDYFHNGETWTYGNYNVQKTGAGTLVLERTSSYNWHGGLTLSQGQVVIHPDYHTNVTPFGTGTLTFDGGTLVTKESNYDGYDDSPVFLENDVVSNGLISTKSGVDLHIGYQGEGSSSITLNANTTINNSGRMLVLEGNIIEPEEGESRSLTVNGSGPVVLTGYNTYSGGTHVQNGVLVFATVESLPATQATNALSASATGYIGFGDDGTTNAGASLTNPQGLFLDRFNKALTLGTIGFDTDPELSVSTNYSGAISLTGFAPSARLGSASHAILSGTITPQDTAYRFGGGGGKLGVQSALNDAGPVVRNVVLDSPAELPLTVRFTSTGNSFTGGVSATQSAAIFGAGALPATGPLTLGTGGYIGVNDIAQGSGLTQAFINRFAPATDRGMIGFDAGSEHVTVTDSISLAGFSDASPGIYLGTARRAHLDGSITPQGSIYRFAAYKGGLLTVNSILAGAGNSVHIGDPSSLGTMGNFQQQEYSTVRLAGSNTYGGTTTLYTGRLQLGHASALGTGALIVQPHSLSLPAGEQEVRPELRVDTGLNIANAINLNADLNIGGSSSTFTLSGPVSGPGELYLDGDYNHLTLSGNNSAFSGGIYMSGYNSALTLGSNNAAGTGPLGFGYTSSAAVYFSTTAPVIGGLMSKEDDDYANLYATQTNTVLTINQPVDSVFRGEFRSSAYPSLESMRLVKTGAGTLRLDDGGMYFYHGTTEATLAGTPEVSLQINQGTLVIGNDFYMGETSPTTVWVHGGTLALDRDPTYYYTYINNPIVVDNNGRLAGNGSFFSSVKIGPGAILAPGHTDQDQTGFLAFDHLELNSGGIYEWQIQDLTLMGQAGHDLIQVGLDEYTATLAINATADDPLTVATDERFTLKIISLALNGTPGLLDGFVPSEPYAWPLFNYDALSGFDPAKFKIDASGFANSLAFGELGNGSFSLSLNSLGASNGQVLLNFTPVPEPSTYALLALGLGLIGWSVWRRRQQ